MDNAAVQVLPVGHFNVYVGKFFQKVSALELKFLRKELSVK